MAGAGIGGRWAAPVGLVIRSLHKKFPVPIGVGTEAPLR
jgi:hypothetical protein